MTRVNKSWVAVVAALLLGTLVGVVWARPNESPQAADITRKVTLAGTDFIPCTDNSDYNVGGNYVICESGFCQFSAPVVFPCLPSVTVERIKLHVNDNNASAYADASIYRTQPSTGTGALLGTAMSPGGTSGGLQTYLSGPINKVVWPSQRAYVFLSVWGTSIYVYGVTVEYHRNI